MSDLTATKCVAPSELSELAGICFKAKFPLLVTGKPGAGKSTIIEDKCKELDMDIIVSHAVVDDPTDYKGFPAVIDIPSSGDANSKQPAAKEATFLPFGDLKRLISADKPTVHFADDLGQAAKMVQAAYMQLLLSRTINGHKISDHVTFVAATNRKKDKAGVQSILTPLLDRFVTIVELENSLEDFIRWGLKEEIAHEVISYVRYRPEVLNEFKPTPDMSQTPTPRGMHNIARMLDAGIPESLQLRCFTGCIGSERAAEFTGFLRIYQNLPDPDQVLMSPKDAVIPDEPSHKYALCGALAARASENNMERLITYAERLPEEFNILLIRDATNAKPQCCKSQAFTQWASNHQDVLMG
jgi:hypothetical protein